MLAWQRGDQIETPGVRVGYGGACSECRVNNFHLPEGAAASVETQEEDESERRRTKRKRGKGQLLKPTRG